MSKKQREAVIVEAARTPIGKHGGYYNALPAEDLGVYGLGKSDLTGFLGVELNCPRDTDPDTEVNLILVPHHVREFGKNRV